MNPRTVFTVLTLALLIPPRAEAQSSGVLPRSPGWRLTSVATSQRRWTGIAVSRTVRIFVSFPRWSGDLDVSVGEVLPDGTVRSFPPGEWNHWYTGTDPTRRLVCAQSLVTDDADHLWILDAGYAVLEGFVPGAAKLVEVDLANDAVLRTVPFDSTVAPRGSYLNDVRVDLRAGVAYLTDSGLGALVVVDLASGRARRVLADHPSTKWEHTALVLAGEPWLRAGGALPEIHADGIALSPDGRFLYYQALCGRTLYRVPAAALRDTALAGEELGRRVETVGRTGAADGLAFDRAGNLYLSAIEADAIHRLTAGGRLETVIHDPRIEWPDSFAPGPDGALYFTTSRLHLAPDPARPCAVFKLTPPR